MNWEKSQVVYQMFVDRFNRGPRFAEKVNSGLYFRDGGKLRKWNEIPSREARGMEHVIFT